MRLLGHRLRRRIPMPSTTNGIPSARAATAVVRFRVRTRGQSPSGPPPQTSTSAFLTLRRMAARSYGATSRGTAGLINETSRRVRSGRKLATTA